MKYLFAAFLLLVFSCKKEYSCKGYDSESIQANAVILYMGPEMADGCGWMVQVNGNELYRPDFLPDSCKQDNLAIKITYTTTSNTYSCGLAATKFSVIHIVKATR